MPVLVGTQRSVAVQQIRGRGLVPSVDEEESADAGGAGDPPGAERRQRSSQPGSTVSIVVSKGEEKATVPNVIGKLRAEAVEALREAGLKPSVQEQETEVPSQVGRVTDQFPPPGSEVEAGRPTVTLVVGKAAADGRSRSRKKKNEGRGPLPAAAPPSTTSRCAPGRRWRAASSEAGHEALRVTISREGAGAATAASRSS